MRPTRLVDKTGMNLHAEGLLEVVQPQFHNSSKRLLPGNSDMEVISWKNTPIFTEIFLLLIRQNTLPYDQRHYH